MYDADPYSVERIMHHKVREEHERIENQRLARLVRPPQRQRVSRQLRWPVCRLGYFLVWLGAWIEQHSLMQPQRLEGRLNRGR